MSKDKEHDPIPQIRLTRAEKQQLAQVMAQAKRPKHPQTAQQTLPYRRMYPDGLCQVTEKIYSRTVRFHDINYQQAQEDDRQTIFASWCGVLNTFPPDVHVQFSFMNTQISEKDFEQSLVLPAQGDGFDAVREEFSSVLLHQVAKGNNALQRSKYITFAVEAESMKAAKTHLEQIELQLLGKLKRLGVQAEALDGKERLQLMHAMLHMDEPQTPFLFDWKWLPTTGLSTRDFIAPSSLHFKDSRRFFIGKKMAAVSFLNILATELDDRVLVDFLSMDTTQIVTMHIQSIDHVEAIKLVKRKLSDLNRSKIDEQKKAVRSGYDIDILPTEMNSYVDSLTELHKRLTSHTERLFLMTFTLMHTGDSRKALDAVIQQAKGIAQEKLCQMVPLDYQQEEGLVSALPLGLNRVEIQRTMTTSETAVFMPFITQELFHRGAGALYYGLNVLSGNLIMGDRKRLNTPNGLILGKPGSGKSFAAKREIAGVVLSTEDHVMVCDPEAEYAPLVNRLHGQVVRISPVSTDYINPLDINLDSAEGDEPIRLKSEFILSLCELVMDDGTGVAAQQKSIIDRALREVYRPYFADPAPENMPILGNLYEELRRMTEPEAAQVATALELYVTGSLNVFNHRTNVQLSNRLVCFDIKQLGSNLKKLGMLIVQDQV